MGKESVDVFDSDINLLAVLVAAAAHMFLGFLWYGPLFGTVWLQGMGKSRDDVGAPGPAIAASMAATLVTAVALGLLLTVPDDPDAAKGATLGALAGVGFVATTSATTAVYEHRDRTVTALGIGYQVVGLIVMGAIIGAWR